MLMPNGNLNFSTTTYTYSNTNSYNLQEYNLNQLVTNK